MSEPVLYTVAEAAKRIGVPYERLSRLVREGEVPVITMSPRTRRIAADDLDAYVSAQPRIPPREPAKMSPARKVRGAATSRLVAAYWQTRGWPYAEPVGGGSPGADVTGTPGIAIEVKARSDLRPPQWLAQAERNAGGALPVVIFRPNGYGPAQIERWGVFMRHADLVTLLRAAGYGDGPDPQIDAEADALVGGALLDVASGVDDLDPAEWL